jgi:hypothetical protein
MGFGWSVHKNGGWRGQYLRLQRWHRLIHRIGRAKTQTEDTEQEHDFLYAYFQNCYHLRDWLRNSGTLTSKALQEFFRLNEPMGVCRDICNGTKHWHIDHPSVDADFSVGREYVPPDWSGERPHVNESWFIVSGKNKYDLFEVADTCMALWDSFLRDNGLLPGSLGKSTSSRMGTSRRCRAPEIL